MGLRVCDYMTVVNPGYGHNPPFNPNSSVTVLGYFGDLPEFLRGFRGFWWFLGPF